MAEEETTQVEPTKFDVTVLCHTSDRDSIQVELGSITQNEANEKIIAFVQSMKSVREGDAVVLQGTTGPVYIVNVNHVIRFEIRSKPSN